MAKSKKSQSAAKKDWTPKKSKSSKRGNYPASKKDCVIRYVKGSGFVKVPVDSLLMTGEREPSKANFASHDQYVAAVMDYRKRYRALMRQVNGKPVKPKTFFDLAVLQGAQVKHPAQLAKLTCNLLGHNSALSSLSLPHDELIIIGKYYGASRANRKGENKV